MAKLKKAENDLEISQQKYSEQEEQLKRKSGKKHTQFK